MTIWLSAGEPSGDRWGARLAEALQRQEPEVRLVGIAGPLMRAAGVSGVAPPGGGGVMGFADPVRHVRSVLAAYCDAVRLLRRGRPALAVVIDYPDFHMRVLKEAKELRIPAIYYIPPQVWAWRPRRARRIAQCCVRVVTAFDWEREWFERWMPPEGVVWCGHPLADDLPPEMPEARDGPIALLPGSRPSEIARLAPVMASAAHRIGSPAVFAADRSESGEWMREAAAKAAGDALPVVVGRTGEVLAGARAAAVCAGSATLEAACAGLPTVIVYRTDWLTYLLARCLVRVRWCGLPNLILRREAYPELVQEALTVETLIRQIERALARPREHWQTLGGEVRARLGEPGVAERVASLVLRTASGETDR